MCIIPVYRYFVFFLFWSDNSSVSRLHSRDGRRLFVHVQAIWHILDQYDTPITLYGSIMINVTAMCVRLEHFVEYVLQPLALEEELQVAPYAEFAGLNFYLEGSC